MLATATVAESSSSGRVQYRCISIEMLCSAARFGHQLYSEYLSELFSIRFLSARCVGSARFVKTAIYIRPFKSRINATSQKRRLHYCHICVCWEYFEMLLLLKRPLHCAAIAARRLPHAGQMRSHKHSLGADDNVCVASSATPTTPQMAAT